MDVDVVTIGESMVLFEPHEDGLIQYTENFKKRVGGAESNVAIGLSKLGHEVTWISRLGNDPFGHYIHSFVQGEGVKVKAMFDSEAPTGVFFKQTGGYSQASIYYYRKNSAASLLNPSDIAEEDIANARYLHITGITPALSESCLATIFYAIKVAKKHNVTIVFDPNIRTKLWESAVYIPILISILKQVDIFLPGEDELAMLFPDQPLDAIITETLHIGVQTIVVKKGAAGAAYYTANEQKDVSGYPNDHVVDPVGAGDGFAAGLLSGLLDGLTISASIDRANRIGSMVTMIRGDCVGLPTREQLESFQASTSDVHR